MFTQLGLLILQHHLKFIISIEIKYMYSNSRVTCNLTTFSLVLVWELC